MKTIVSLLMKYRYFALFPLAAIEGPIVALVAGFFVHMGYLSLIPSFIILIFGDIIPDGIYYYIGRVGNKNDLHKKYAKNFKIVAGGYRIIEQLFKEHPRKTLFLSKLAYGFSIPFLISAGLVKISYRQFFMYAIPATLFQYGLLITVGFYLGKSYEAAVSYVKYGGILFALILVAFVGTYISLVIFARKKINTMDHE